MKKKFNIKKNELDGQTIIINFNKLSGYKVLPKTKKENEIEVNEIVFVNKSFSEKIIKRKINAKINKLLKVLEDIENGDDEAGTEHGIRQTLVEAERLKLSIINSYIKFLGSEYRGLTLKKLEIIIEKLRTKLYLMKQKNKIMELDFDFDFNNNYDYYEEKEEKRGRGR